MGSAGEQQLEKKNSLHEDLLKNYTILLLREAHLSQPGIIGDAVHKLSVASCTVQYYTTRPEVFSELFESLTTLIEQV